MRVAQGKGEGRMEGVWMGEGWNDMCKCPPAACVLDTLAVVRTRELPGTGLRSCWGCWPGASWPP